MLKTIVSSSTNQDPKKAGIEAAAKLKEITPKIVLAYSSVDYDLSKLIGGIKEELGDVPVLGNTSFTGVITPEGYISGENGFVGLMGLSGDLTVGVSASPAGDCPREVGKEMALEAMKMAGKTTPPDFYYFAASPGAEEEYIKGISEVIGRAPMFGGSAADNTITGLWSLYCGDKIFSDGAIVAFFYTDAKIVNKFTGAYRETGDFGVITKINGKRVLAEIDGEPALKKYAKWAGVEADTLKGGALLGFTVTSPLGVKDRLGELTAIRHPMNGNDDYSMNVGANLAEKTAVMRMEATVDELIESSYKTLEELKEKAGSKASFYHLVHCGGRRAGIDSRINEVYEGVKKVAGDVPFIMEFTFGEYGFEHDGNNTVGGLMLSYTAFLE